MFERKTVFILGAGASWHYNYPTGDDLVNCVLAKTKYLIKCYQGDLKRGTVGGISSINKIMGLENPDFPEVINFLDNFHNRLKYVNPPVIDYFLQVNQDLQDIGKLMIAWVILERETEFRKYGNMNRQRVFPSTDGFRDDWYRYILYKTLIGCENYKEVFSNNVDFVSFNYDVSLDHYLYKGLRQIEFMKPDHVSEGELKKQVEKRIHHVYGYVRESDPFAELEMSFLQSSSSTVEACEHMVDAAYRASKSIDTIAGQKREIPKDVLDKLANAQDIYILGFGFDKINCDSLDAHEYFSHGSAIKYPQEQDYRRVYFTNFCDHNSINKKVSKLFGLPDPHRFFSETGGPPIYRDYRSRGEGQGAAGLHYEKSAKNVYDALSQDFDLID